MVEGFSLRVYLGVDVDWREGRNTATRSKRISDYGRPYVVESEGVLKTKIKFFFKCGRDC